jgi:DNA-binding NarL/FixJ family response regulator
MKAQFARTLKAIAAHTSLCEYEILHSLRTEAVSARHTLCALLAADGYTARQIAHSLNCTERTVLYAIRKYSDRCKALRYVSVTHEIVKKQISNNADT